MTPKLVWFTVRLALIGLLEDRAPKVIQDLRDDLGMLSHLRNPQVAWDSQAHRVMIQVDTEDISAQPAAEQIREEMMEALAAVLWETEGTHFEILESYLSADQ